MTHQPSPEFMRLYRQGKITKDEFELVTHFEGGWIAETFERDIIKKATTR